MRWLPNIATTVRLEASIPCPCCCRLSNVGKRFIYSRVPVRVRTQSVSLLILFPTVYKIKIFTDALKRFSLIFVHRILLHVLLASALENVHACHTVDFVWILTFDPEPTASLNISHAHTQQHQSA